jgi:hypothetical protein
MATTAATRPESRPRSDQETRPDAIQRLLGERLRQGLSARVTDPVTLGKLVAALKNGDGNGHIARLTKAEKRQLLARPPP